MRIRLLFVFLIAFSTVALAADNSADRAALLKLHAEDREGHLKSNADLIVAQLAPTVHEVVGGHVKTMTRDEAKQEFSHYLTSVKYTAWDDAQAPIITISPDGNMAWMIVETKASVAPVDHPDQVRSFRNSAIQTYVKGPNGWEMTAIAATIGR